MKIKRLQLELTAVTGRHLGAGLRTRLGGGLCVLQKEASGQGIFGSPGQAHRLPFRFYAHISLPLPPAGVSVSLKYTSLILSFLSFKACLSFQILPQMPACYFCALPFKNLPKSSD